MSPPITPAPTTCTRSSGTLLLPPRFLSRSCSTNTRTRLREVSPTMSSRDGARFGFVRGLATRAMLRPQVDDGVGRRVVLRARLGAHLGDELLLDQRAHQRPGQHAIEQPRLALLGLAADQLARGGLGIGGIDQPVEEARALRLVGAQRLAGEHHFHGGAHAGAAHGAHRAAEARMDAEHHFGQTDREFVAPDADAVTAGERELEAAAEREAVDDGDRRAGQRFEPIEDPLRGAHQFERLRGARRAARTRARRRRR